MGVGQELTNGLKGVGHVFSFMPKKKSKIKVETIDVKMKFYSLANKAFFSHQRVCF